MSFSPKEYDRSAVVKIIMIYAFFGGAWIYFSDTVVGWLVHDPVVMTYLAISKGMLFIVITASILYFLIARYAKRSLKINRMLMEREEFLRSIASNTPGVIYQFYASDTGDSGLTYVSERSSEIFGISPDPEQFFPAFTSRVVEEDRDRFLESIRKATSAREPWTFEGRFVKPDGEMLWFMGRSTPKQDGGRLVYNGVLLDITDRKRMEEELRESGEKFSRTFRMSPDTMTVSRIRDGVYIDVNDEFSRQMGYPREDAIGKSVFELGIWADASERERMMDILRTKGEIQEENYSFRCKDGVIKTGEMSARVVTIGGEPCLLSMVRDITEKIEAQRALSESEERYRSVVERSLVGIAIIDDELRYTYVNEEFCRISGYSRQEMLGRNFTFPLTEESMGMVKERFRRRQAGEDVPTQYEFSFIHKNGSRRFGELRSAVYPDSSGRVKTIIQVIDITIRKLSDEALRKSEAQYRLLAENVSDIIFTMDTSLRFTYISPSVERIRGYTVEEAMAQTPEEVLAPASLEIAMKVFSQEMEMEERETKKLWRTWTEELEEYCKDGSTIWTECSFSTLRDEENMLTGFLGITRDITERKRVEEEKKKLEEQLVRTQRIEAIGTLAGGIAHDFNNLLTGILGNVSLVLVKMDGEDPLRERLKNIEEYVQRGSDLAKQLLGFARGGKYEVKPTDLGKLILKSSEMFGRTKKEIQIHHRIQPGLWTVEVDRGQIEQVLLNLFVNAWQSMPGGGNLYLSADNVELGEVEVSPYKLKPGKFVRTTVADTGVGMSDAVKARIFEPFFTTRERDRGTGLGLASVYGILNNHGGFVNVESQEGKGSAFTFYLPASDKTPVHDSDSARNDIQTGSETILIIDDESMILDVGTRMLEGMNYRVMTAGGGGQGVKIYEKEHDRIDLVILDMIMPDLSGKETFEALVKINPSVKVLLSSGYSLDEQAREIMQKGCKGFIQKPFTMVELSQKVRSSLDA